MKNYEKNFALDERKKSDVIWNTGLSTFEATEKKTHVLQTYPK